MTKTISPAALVALKEALTALYWYKNDLRSFLSATLSNVVLVSSLNWGDYKRNIVGRLVDYLTRHQDEYQGDLLRLISEVSAVRDFSHLERLEDGKNKAQVARMAVEALRKHTAGHRKLLDEQEEAEARRRKAYEELMRKTAVRDRLDKLNRDCLALVLEPNPQQRGYRLEKLLCALFELFDLDPRASFKLEGEQIDGAFTLYGTDYLLEGKWQTQPVAAGDLDILAAKLSRKLDNTLGLFLSVNGFSEEGVRAHSSGRRMMFLMDGSDLMAVLEGRIDLVQLLIRKRREAAQTGNIYLKINEIL